MTKEKSLHRGEEDTRSHFERARDGFNEADSRVRVVERVDTTADNGGCPTCHQPMLLRHTYREPNHYHFEGLCSADESHDVERYGYFHRTEGTTVGGGIDPAVFERKRK